MDLIFLLCGIILFTRWVVLKIFNAIFLSNKPLKAKEIHYHYHDNRQINILDTEVN